MKKQFFRALLGAAFTFGLSFTASAADLDYYPRSYKDGGPIGPINYTDQWVLGAGYSRVSHEGEMDAVTFSAAFEHYLTPKRVVWVKPSLTIGGSDEKSLEYINACCESWEVETTSKDRIALADILIGGTLKWELPEIMTSGGLYGGFGFGYQWRSNQRTITAFDEYGDAASSVREKTRDNGFVVPVELGAYAKFEKLNPNLRFDISWKHGFEEGEDLNVATAKMAYEFPVQTDLEPGRDWGTSLKKFH